MATDLGFRYQALAMGEVVIERSGKRVTILRGEVATRFLDSVKDASFEDQQGAMARITGNYRRGNERMAKDHPRNS